MLKEIGKLKIDLNDGSWKVLKPKRKVNPKLNGTVKKKKKPIFETPSLDELDGPTNDELDIIESEEIIDMLLEDIALENDLWQMDLFN
jgi:ribosome assembly protein YihI (activator of Der GTPase)